jgi:hypothetical protein
MIFNSPFNSLECFVKTFTKKNSIYVLEELEFQLLNEKMQIKLDVKKRPQMIP